MTLAQRLWAIKWWITLGIPRRIACVFGRHKWVASTSFLAKWCYSCKRWDYYPKISSSSSASDSAATIDGRS